MPGASPDQPEIHMNMRSAVNNMVNAQLRADAYASDRADYGMRAEYKANGESAGRTYLKVAYANKDHAKRSGAKWDAAAKAWYVMGEVPAALRCYL
jgi:hypothetical protein